MERALRRRAVVVAVVISVLCDWACTLFFFARVVWRENRVHSLLIGGARMLLI